ncbi:HlyD family efflux transporter periplasmic adaptor subunit [Cellulomonas hominis]|uniref:HlyD family efflux transporter periplasmic adaptor subunit n=1 Tax=Cellulomonas hominis TaxID=156981 RepID=UPI001C0FC424|nr:biotin/lipoyl-binding protein [Cellulomonas hominis]MBU5421952.1 HlyD family efflux transporter periplasmic adaptor subunit [Cellulomonas hominis]
MRDSLRRLARRRHRPAAPASPATARAARRTRRRRLVVGGTAGALALLLAGGGVAFALGRSGGPGYRTATAELGTVEQTVDTTGTVASARRADRSFSVAGTVGSVAVAVGDTVAAGQVLASLDPASLQDAVDEAEQAVADAQQRLEDDIASQTSTSTSSSSTSSSSSSSSSSSAGGATTGAVTPDTGTSGGTGGSSGSDGSDGSGGSGGGATDPAVTAAVAAVTEAQQALLAQHETARAALATATDAVAAAQDTCQVFLELDLGGETPDATTPDATETADAEGVAADEGTGTATPGTEELAACQDATSAVLAAQTAVDEAQTALASLATDLDAAVSEALRALAVASAASGGSGTTTPGATTEPGTTTPADTGTTATTGTDQSATAQAATGAPTTGGTGSTGGTGGSTVASAADLLADQAAIDQAEADLAVAQSALGMVDLTTPIAGTVASVAIAAGDAVEASSTTAVITVLGEDGYTVSTTVSLSQVDLIEVGQTAQVRAGSTDEELTGTVTGIGLLNASTTSSDPSYTVDIALDPSDAALFDGSSAQVSIAVAASDATLTVPSSAVHLDGGTATVQVLRDGTVEEVEVERGAVGPERTEIADGLAEGDEVVLADLGQAMTTDDATSGTGLSGLGGSSDQAPDQVRGGMMVPGGQTGGGQMMAPPGS